jgi:hypothetical protein
MDPIFVEKHPFFTPKKGIFTPKNISPAPLFCQKRESRGSFYQKKGAREGIFRKRGSRRVVGAVVNEKWTLH